MATPPIRAVCEVGHVSATLTNTNLPGCNARLGGNDVSGGGSQVIPVEGRETSSKAAGGHDEGSLSVRRGQFPSDRSSVGISHDRDLRLLACRPGGRSESFDESVGGPL